MAGTRSLIGAVAISLGLHAVVLVVPIRTGHYSPRPVSRVLEASLSDQTVFPPVSDSWLLSSDSVAAPTPGGTERASVERATEAPPDASGPMGMPLPAAAQPIYFTAGELHRRPSPIGTVLQEEAGRIYPDSVTRLRLLISERGQVDHAEILETTNPGFAREALQAFATARYAPGAIAGRRVKSEMRVEVTASNAMGMVIRPQD